MSNTVDTYRVNGVFLLLIVCRLIVCIPIEFNYKGGFYMDIVRVFGTNMKKYRMQRGLSQEAFAEKCGLHRTYISSIERFQRNVSIENIQRIADALDVETYLLFVEKEEVD